ncbi:hypothetical protein Pst134EA_011237 [Puccinia striiformis f. sp. tritici]|uniref:hypothetical protein n=1 Tax=Puccinia striiformis f. sp. tritici TaxID=168172 RepID=UPI002008BDF0|nr:hypothetical protein Pst134EA_011237 [Puccinia striiformis f. sp. tritici]KAH9467598.1 hypothetical protein Pst134EA_011237 [Puccinia striiformis f. sp. tritici]KAI9608208.1 hypothetical protein KEM48_003341 [Puccinia striiformis f. sp. tritici PST-130]
MFQLFRLNALVVLIASSQVISQPQDPNTYFGCWKDWDAVCSHAKALGDVKKRRLEWAERLHPKKRDYACHNNGFPFCCPQGLFTKRINDSSDHTIVVWNDEVKPCNSGGQ